MTSLQTLSATKGHKIGRDSNGHVNRDQQAGKSWFRPAAFPANAFQVRGQLLFRVDRWDLADSHGRWSASDQDSDRTRRENLPSAKKPTTGGTAVVLRNTCLKEHGISKAGPDKLDGSEMLGYVRNSMHCFRITCHSRLRCSLLG
jgi:hypothetical protein